MVVVERELRVDRDQLPDAHDGVDPLARRERVLHRVGGRGQPVAEQVLEQQLAEAAARLRRPQRLLELGEVVRAREHLRRGAVELAELLDDLRRRLAGAALGGQQAAVDPLQALVDAAEAPLDLRDDLGGGLAARAPELGPQEAREPDEASAQKERDGRDDEQRDHEPQNATRGIGRSARDQKNQPRRVRRPTGAECRIR